MLYHVHMEVKLPADMDPPQRTELLGRETELLGREKAYSQGLQRDGKWTHIWRVVGEYANYSIFDVDSNDELHEILSGLPLFPYMTIRVTPLAQHPSDIRTQ